MQMVIFDYILELSRSHCRRPILGNSNPRNNDFQRESDVFKIGIYTNITLDHGHLGKDMTNASHASQMLRLNIDEKVCGRGFLSQVPSQRLRIETSEDEQN
jgi:hypothetical protein